jgi:hypothetical protein
MCCACCVQGRGMYLQSMTGRPSTIDIMYGAYEEKSQVIV